MSEFEGTIIDIETIGNFNNVVGDSDSRRYKEIIPVIFGYIDSDGLSIVAAEDKQSIEVLKEEIIALLNKLEKPFYAFNSLFERGVLFHSIGKDIEFLELNTKRFEKKEYVVSLLEIPQYDDPFRGNGKLCSEAWLRGDVDKSIKHNRSCLLKEKDILLKRGWREPDSLELVR